MILAFFLGRMIFIPYFYYKIFSVWSHPQRRAVGNLVCSVMTLSAGILDILNVYWFFKILKAAATLLLKLRQEKKSQQNVNEAKTNLVRQGLHSPPHVAVRTDLGSGWSRGTSIFYCLTGRRKSIKLPAYHIKKDSSFTSGGI